MALENVIEDIINQANGSASELIKEGEEEADHLLSKAHIEAKQKLEKFEEESRNIAEEKKNSELTAARLEQKRMTLAAKKMATENIFNEIKSKIAQLSRKDNEDLAKTLVQKAKKELKDAKYVYSNSADKRVVEKMGLEFAGTIDCLGGIIVENSDKSVRVNLTFDRLFEDFKEDINEHITKTFS